jgi:hypothetical protein
MTEPTPAQLWEARGAIFGAAQRAQRGPQGIGSAQIALAKQLPAAGQNALAAELRRATAQRRDIAESATDCDCLKIGHGPNCTKCGSGK